ncbi:MAG: hypothetical protein ABH814_02155 [bacterium]
MKKKLIFFLSAVSLLGILALVFLFKGSFFTLKTTEDAYQNQDSNLSSVRVAVGAGVGADWFETWARFDDILVVFGDNPKISDPPKVGLQGWNTPSFDNVLNFQGNNLPKVILLDFEMWDKTSAQEKTDVAWAAKRAETYAKDNGLEFVFGTSWRINVESISVEEIRSSVGRINWAEYLNESNIANIASNVGRYGINATGMRAEDAQQYVDFFNACAQYATEINPNIKLWPVLDARNQSAAEMVDSLRQFQGNIEGVVIMGGRDDTGVISEFLSTIRSDTK